MREIGIRITAGRLRHLTICSFAFVFLFAQAKASETPCIWTGIQKIVAVGDLHGDYENFVNILMGTGLVDENLRWTGQTAHFVQTGDIMDRGPDAKKIFDLLMRLENEAAQAGGMVHVLLGNHEEMNFTGIAFSYPDYITVDQFLSFLPRDYREKKEKRIYKALGRSAATAASESPNAAADEGIRDSWQKLMKTDKEAQAEYIAGFNNPYGRWLLNKNAVIRINDTIFVHGGISEKYSTWKLKDINDLLRNELYLFYRLHSGSLPKFSPFKSRIVYDPQGPLWFRGLAIRDERAIKDEFERILNNLGAGHMVIAHTFYGGNGMSPVISSRFMSRFDKKLWIIDTGISEFYGGANSALLIDKENFVLWGDGENQDISFGLNQQKNAGGQSAEEDEAFLKSSAIETIIRTAQKGRTGPWTILLDDGKIIRKAVFKYVDRPRPALLPDSFRYELAAYAVNKLLDLGIVPPVVLREIDGVEGSLQIFVENAIPEAVRRRQGPEPPDPAGFRDALESVKIFALLVNDKCENFEDTFVNPETWHIRRVDFSEAFGPCAELPPDCAVSGRKDALYRKLLALDDHLLDDKLSAYLNEEEIRALIKRKAGLLKLLESLP